MLEILLPLILSGFATIAMAVIGLSLVEGLAHARNIISELEPSLRGGGTRTPAAPRPPSSLGTWRAAA